MKKGKVTDKISTDMPSTIEYEGKVWKVSDRRIKGKFLCEGMDENKNPKSRLVRTKWLLPKDFVAEEQKLNQDYDEVVQSWGWDVTSLFREVINKENREKDIEETAVQREFKNGSWNVMNPLDLMNELNEGKKDEVSAVTEFSDKAKKNVAQVYDWSKVQFWVLVAAIVTSCVAIGAVLSRFWKGGN